MTTSRRPRSEGRLAAYIRQCEAKFLHQALKQQHGHNSQTAVWLGVSRRALYGKMREHGLDGEASALRTEAGIMGPRKVDLDPDRMPPKKVRPGPSRGQKKAR